LETIGSEPSLAALASRGVIPPLRAAATSASHVAEFVKMPTELAPPLRADGFMREPTAAGTATSLAERPSRD
jgi:hypothetical protein